MNNMPFNMSIGSVEVRSTNNRGFTPEETAELCTDKLVHVSQNAPTAIRDQVLAYIKAVNSVIVIYM